MLRVRPTFASENYTYEKHNFRRRGRRYYRDSTDYEDAIRNAISIGGDSDTVACITGGIAAAFYRHIPEEIRNFALKKLPADLRNVVFGFEENY